MPLNMVCITPTEKQNEKLFRELCIINAEFNFYNFYNFLMFYVLCSMFYVLCFVDNFLYLFIDNNVKFLL
jgi:hypothetical protein